MSRYHVEREDIICDRPVYHLFKDGMRIGSFARRKDADEMRKELSKATQMRKRREER
jgi:hypothetical protein